VRPGTWAYSLPPVFGHDACKGACKGPATVERLSQQPRIAYVRHLLSAAESHHLVAHAAAATGDARTAPLSESGRYGRHRVLRSLQRRLVALSGRSVEHFEPMTAVLCRRGERLRPHWDAEEYPRALRDAGQSVISFFVHLTTLAASDGGALVFPRLGLAVQPVAGDAVCWLNVTRFGRVHRKTLHHGDEVTGDVDRWEINVWIREPPLR
jgi:hypothetical protein